MKALSSAGLSDSHLESTSPTACRTDKPALSADLLMKSDRNISLLLSAVVDRGAPDRRSASSVACRPPSMGGRPRRGEVCAPRSAEAAGGANAGRNYGRKQAPSHGGLTRPAKRPPGSYCTPAGTWHPVRLCRTGPPREGGAL